MNDYFTREKNAMALYDATTKAGQANAQNGGNPLAAKMTAMAGGGMLPLAPIMPAGPGTKPWSGESSKLMSGDFMPFGGLGMQPQSAGGDPPAPRPQRPVSRGSGQPQMMGGMPFGGFRAKGGPVRPGTAYVVGEEGQELFVPQVPGQIVPNPGMRLARDFGAQLNAEAGMARVREKRAQLPGGTAFVGPVAPKVTGPKALDAAFQPEAKASTGSAAPMTPSSRASVSGPRPLEAAFTPSAADNGSRIPQSPMNRGYAPGSLAGRPVRQIGRSANDPERIAERMRRQGDPRAIMQLGQMKMGQAFSREMNDVNFNQSMQMRGLYQAFMAERDAQQQGQQLEGEQRQNARRDAEWQRGREAELADRAGQSIDSAFTMTSPNGQFFVPMVKDKGGNARPMGGAFPMPKPPEQIQGMQQDAEKRGYDLIQMPSGEWKLNKRDGQASGGWETTTTDAEGNTTRSVRKPIGGAGAAAGSRTSGLSIF